ncbi:winged helix-turn-helix domain-containing protein [Dermacoccus nishinomiyaensis]|uniref:winged helix-turn-helix domain-containing protein n=1 Tax=Dermacoccus nishinomiyaensis TaxID=1274 RepID=UPI001EF58C5F|nr:restriction endonuclease [Dermacoccus nishinomiyaensis]
MANMAADASLVPIWPVLVVPTLLVLSDGRNYQRREIFDAVAERAGISDAARAETLKSGGTRFEQRMGWVLSYLGKAKWVDKPERGHYVISDAGRKALANYSDGFDYARARTVFTPFWPEKAKPSSPETVLSDAEEISDPIEVIEDAVTRIEARVGDDLLDRLRNSHPDFFEQAVVDLLLKMGYGGAAQRGKRIGGSGDEGIDGLIDQDALGSSKSIYRPRDIKRATMLGGGDPDVRGSAARLRGVPRRVPYDQCIHIGGDRVREEGPAHYPRRWI